jgi:predicted metal-dependent hydrolase
MKIEWVGGTDGNGQESIMLSTGDWSYVHKHKTQKECKEKYSLRRTKEEGIGIGIGIGIGREEEGEEKYNKQRERRKLRTNALSTRKMTVEGVTVEWEAQESQRFKNQKRIQGARSKKNNVRLSRRGKEEEEEEQNRKQMLV